MRFRHAPDRSHDQCFSGLLKFLHQNWLAGHSNKTSDELAADGLPSRLQNLGDGPVVTDQIDDERTAQVFVDAFIRKQVAYVEEVAGMLPVKRGDDFSGVEIWKRYNLNFREAELFFDARRN